MMQNERARLERLESLRFRALVAAALRPHIVALAREMVPAPHVLEGTQRGLVIVLLTIERAKSDPELAEALDGADLSTDETFRRVALDAARAEIEAWNRRVERQTHT